MVSPVGFLHTVERIRSCFDRNRELSVGIPELASLVRTDAAECATAVAALVNSGVLCWRKNKIVRVDFPRETLQRRTA